MSVQTTHVDVFGFEAAPRPLFLPDRNCKKKKREITSMFFFYGVNGEFVATPVGPSPRQTRQLFAASQKLGKVFGDRKDPDAEPELDPVSESDSDPSSVNFSMGKKKHSNGGTAPRTLGQETPRHHVHVTHVTHVF